MNRFAKFPLVLGLVGALCAGALGLVYQVTNPIIQERLAGQSLAAIREIVPAATAADDITTTFEAQKLTDAGIVKIYEVKVNTTTAAYAYQATVGGWAGQPIVAQFVVSATENNFLGMKIISHQETKGGNYGAILLESPLFAAQFVNLDITTISSSIQLVAGSTANLTLIAVRTMANKIATFHVEEVKGEEVKEIPDAAFAQMRFPAGTTFVDVTEYYEDLAGAQLETVQDKTGIKYLFYAKDASDNILGFVYYIDYENQEYYDGYNFKKQYIKALFGFTTTYTDAKLFIVDMVYGTDYGAESLDEKVIANFTADNIGTWFDDTSNVPNDVAAGVSITSHEINEIIKHIIHYHVVLNVTTGG